MHGEAPIDRPLVLRLNSAIRIESDPDRVFGELHDFENLCRYVPGATVTRAVGPRTFEARMMVGLRPFMVNLAGTAHIVRSDLQSRQASFDLLGSAGQGWGRLHARMKISVTPDKRGSALQTAVWLSWTGRTSLLGRRLLDRIASEVLAQTGERIKRQLESGPPRRSARRAEPGVRPAREAPRP